MLVSSPEGEHCHFLYYAPRRKTGKHSAHTPSNQESAGRSVLFGFLSCLLSAELLYFGCGEGSFALFADLDGVFADADYDLIADRGAGGEEGVGA